jgi:hypothetical protein
MHFCFSSRNLTHATGPYKDHFLLKCVNTHYSIIFFSNFFSLKDSIHGHLPCQFQLAASMWTFLVYTCTNMSSWHPLLLYCSRRSRLIEVFREDRHGYWLRKPELEKSKRQWNYEFPRIRKTKSIQGVFKNCLYTIYDVL